VLLVAIVAAFLVRPLIGDSPAGAAVFSLAMLVLLLLALYDIDVDPGRGAGRNADEPISKSAPRTSNPRFRY